MANHTAHTVINWQQHMAAKIARHSAAPLVIPRQQDGSIGFLSLPAEARNAIYDLISAHHNYGVPQMTLSADKGPREVPPALARACRQIRGELLPYFFQHSTLILVADSLDNLSACFDWLAFTSDHALSMIRRLRIRHSHPRPKRKPCSLNFELGLDDPINDDGIPSHCWGRGNVNCILCNPPEPTPAEPEPLDVVAEVDAWLQRAYLERCFRKDELLAVLSLLQAAIISGITRDSSSTNNPAP